MADGLGGSPLGCIVIQTPMQEDLGKAQG